MHEHISLNSRIYIQYRPEQAALNAIMSARDSLRDGNTRIVRQEELHMSVLHLGKLDVLFDRLGTYGKMDERRYLNALEEFLKAIGDIAIPKTLSLSANGYERFGRLLVMRFEEPDTLTQARGHILQALEAALNAMGLGDMGRVMGTYPDFVHLQSFIPHVGLLSPAPTTVAPVPSETMLFTLGTFVQTDRLA